MKKTKNSTFRRKYRKCYFYYAVIEDGIRSDYTMRNNNPADGKIVLRRFYGRVAEATGN